MSDTSETTGENTSDFPPQESSHPSMDLGDEGKRFGQALLADRGFIQAISSAIAGKPHGSATRPELPGTKRSAGELDGPGDLVGKSVDSTSTSRMAKHFRHDSPFYRELEPINIDDTTDESAVQGEYSDSVEASQIVKDYPRPNVDAAFTPRLDSYLPSLMGGLTGPDAELREIQDKVLDIMDKNCETRCGNSSELGDSSYYISGRPSHSSRFRADCQTPPGNSYESPRKLGVYHQPKKSVLAPVQRIQFLGLSVDSVTLCLALPRDKVGSIRRECEGLIANPVATVRQLAHLLGWLSSSIQAVLPAPLYYRYLQQAKIQAL